MADLALLLLGGLFLCERLWKHVAVVCFFRRPRPVQQSAPALVSILQPILSGDPTLPACLQHNLRFGSRWPVEYLWLVDADDAVGQQLCRDLIAGHPGRDVRLILLPPPPDGSSPKTTKLIAGARLARGDVLCVLDDDTMLPHDGLETCLPYLDEPGVGLAFGLPYYVSFTNFWSSLVAAFVNSHSLLTYVPYTYLVEPFTINGMFFAVKRSVLDAVGGFAGLEHLVADDFAIAQRFRAHGYRLAQTPLRHAISTHVPGPRQYFRLLKRWFIFPRETVMKALPWPALVVSYGLGLLPALLPLCLLVYLAVWTSWGAAAYVALYLGHTYAIALHFNVRYLRRATPWRRSWLVPLVQVLLPVHLLIALFSGQRIVWRGHVMQIERGGRFRFLKRRTA
jgi:ceramide glucosyltransferase